jgi:predicted 3-demethylubiquinone-9 3-methyltransferase (glyoxalase superfamily)
MQKIVTFLMFNDQAEEAVQFYASVFGEHAEVVDPMSFKLFGQEFYTFNGGPTFNFSLGMSLFIHCDSQEEVDYYWEKLAEGGQHSQCGWLQDRFGVSWQVVPEAFLRLSSDPDPVKSKRVVDAMLKMTKFNIAELEAAYRGE